MRERHECEGWTAVCRLDEIEAGRGVVRIVNGTEVALMRDGDGVFGIGNLCPHRGGQIGDGHVEDGKAICPLHAWDFDLRTGISPFNPVDTLPTYPVRVVDGSVEVDADRVPHAPARPMTYLGEWTRRGAADRGMYLVHHLALDDVVNHLPVLDHEAGEEAGKADEVSLSWGRRRAPHAAANRPLGHGAGRGYQQGQRC